MRGISNLAYCLPFASQVRHLSYRCVAYTTEIIGVKWFRKAHLNTCIHSIGVRYTNHSVKWQFGYNFVEKFDVSLLRLFLLLWVCHLVFTMVYNFLWRSQVWKILKFNFLELGNAQSVDLENIDVDAIFFTTAMNLWQLLMYVYSKIHLQSIDDCRRCLNTSCERAA